MRLRVLLASSCCATVYVLLFAAQAPGPPLHPRLDGVDAPPDGVRTIRLRLALDEEYRARGGDATRALVQLAEVNRSFEAQIGVRWEVVDVVPWVSFDHARTLHQLRASLEPLVVPGVDVVLGLSGQDGKKDDADAYDRGTAAFFGRTAVFRPLADGGPWPYAAETMAHELGHVLGAWHTRDADTPMRPRKGRAACLVFDSTNVEAMRLVRHLDFERGVLGLDDAQVARLMELWCENHDRDEYVPVPHALHVRAHAVQQAHPDEAIALCRRAVRLLEEAGHGDDDFAARALLLEGTIENRAGRPDRARACLERALRIVEWGRRPVRTRFHVRLQLGVAYEAERRYARAAACFTDALRDHQDEVDAYSIEWAKARLRDVTERSRLTSRRR